MKKFILFFILIVLPVITYSQLTGDGSYANPWSGTLAGDAAWSGTKYINGDITVDNEKLIISPGAIIIFLTENADLIVTGTGLLEADGTQESIIHFTADDDNDGNYGETGERWGHISFQSMGGAGESLIDNCIIEFGDVSSTSILPVNPSQYGGAIHTDFSNLTISNCEIRNNKAGWGGGIFIGDGRNPDISNCYFHNNTATTSGGGIYSWKNSYPVISNSIIVYNICSGTGGGGGIFIGGAAKGVKVINCLISNNTANSQTLGHNIKIFTNTATPKPQLINSIIWSPANSIVGSTFDADFYYCAIQNPPRSTYTGCISLNAANEGTNPDGPFFASMSGSNWPLQFRSPCRDAGTTPSPAVTNDYIGNSRVYNYDMGAYEYQYNRWTGTSGTDWATSSNWSGGVPDGTKEVVIPTGLTNYPVSPSNPDFTLGSGKLMIIESGARLTLNNLTNNGTLKLNHDASGFASLILNSYTRGAGGTEEIQLFLSGGGSSFLEDYKWHYISSPVSSLSTDIFTAATLDLAQFIESRPSTSLQQGWVAYDGYIYSTGGSGGPTFSSLTPGQGYNFWDDSDNTFTFGGSFNTSDLTMPLGYSGVPATMHGFNLLGNPFSSGLDWDDIIEGVYFAYPANTSKSLYFTRDNTQCTYAAGVGIPEDVNGIIPPMQGFFTKAYATGSITLPAAARTHDNIHPRYKGDDPIPLVRLAIFENTVSNDETVVRFDEEAKSDLDNDFDAVKMFLTDTKTSIYTNLGGIDYAINGLPFPATSVEIPVVVNVTTKGMHKISTTQLQGLDNYYIYLKDNLTSAELNLKDTPDLSFSAPAGKISGRFILKISTTPTSTEDPQLKPGQFIIYHGYDFINIQPLADDWAGIPASIRLMDMSGKSLTDMQNVEFQKNSLVQMQAPKAKGLYFVEIRSGIRRFVGKVVVK